MSLSNQCLKHRLLKIARSGPPGGGESPLSEDNDNVLNFQQQRTTRQPQKVVWKNLFEKNDQEFTIKPKKEPYEFEQGEDYPVLSDVSLSDQHLPGYGHPDFMACSRKLLRVAAKLPCSCS